MICAASMSLSNVIKDMSSLCLLTIYIPIGPANINENVIIKEYLHVEHSHLFLDAQLQPRPIQTGEHAACEL